jgi:hypothetical protein
MSWLRTGSAAIARDMILRLHLKRLPFFPKEKNRRNALICWYL